MEYLIHRISLDIHSTQSQVMLRVKRADTNRKIYISLREAGIPYHIANDCTAKLSAQKPDGNYIYNNCEIKDNTIIYTFTDQTAPAVGMMDCEIALYNSNGQRLVSPHFAIVVEKTIFYGDEIISTSERLSFEDLITRAENTVSNGERFIAENLLYNGTSFSNAVKGRMSGAAVTANDVSPIEHIVKCKMKSKNLLNLSRADFDSCIYNKDINGITSNINNLHYCNIWVDYLNDYLMANKGKTFTFSTSTPIASDRAMSIIVLGVRSDGKTYQEASIKGVGSVSITIDKEFTSIDHIELRLNRNLTSAFSDTDSTFADLQFEFGEIATEFEEYIDPLSTTIMEEITGATYTPDVDGTCEIKSVYPAMTLYTNNDRVTLDVEYNRDISSILADLFAVIEQNAKMVEVVEVPVPVKNGNSYTSASLAAMRDVCDKIEAAMAEGKTVMLPHPCKNGNSVFTLNYTYTTSRTGRIYHFVGFDPYNFYHFQNMVDYPCVDGLTYIKYDYGNNALEYDDTFYIGVRGESLNTLEDFAMVEYGVPDFIAVYRACQLAIEETKAYVDERLGKK